MHSSTVHSFSVSAVSFLEDEEMVARIAAEFANSDPVFVAAVVNEFLTRYSFDADDRRWRSLLYRRLMCRLELVELELESEEQTPNQALSKKAAILDVKRQLAKTNTEIELCLTSIQNSAAEKSSRAAILLLKHALPIERQHDLIEDLLEEYKNICRECSSSAAFRWLWWQTLFTGGRYFVGSLIKVLLGKD